jgi:hypothetical protein
MVDVNMIQKASLPPKTITTAQVPTLTKKRPTACKFFFIHKSFRYFSANLTRKTDFISSTNQAIEANVFSPSQKE